MRRRYLLAGGVEWCPVHHGVADEIRDHPDGHCDMVEKCGGCDGEGFTRDGYEPCDQCGGDGYEPCDLRTLFYKEVDA